MLILVLADPGAPHLKSLRKLSAEVLVGESGAHFKPEDIARAEVVVNDSHHVRDLEQLWPNLKSMRWLHSLSAGVENLMFSSLKASSVPLTNARGVYKRSLGEWTMLAMLYFAKDVRRLLTQQGAAKWDQFDCDMLDGSTVAIIGYGEIGREVAGRAKGFGMTVIATRRRVTEKQDDLADEILPSSENAIAMSRADYVVLSSALTAETRRMIGAREFGAMKTTAVFINIGRGAVVDETALVNALEQKKIRGAALDVFEKEPLPPGHPLWRLDNVLISPHCADNTATWKQDSVDFFMQNFERYASGQPLQNVVDKEAGY